MSDEQQAAPPRYEVREREPGRWWVWDCMEEDWYRYPVWIGEVLAGKDMLDKSTEDEAGLRWEIERRNQLAAESRAQLLKREKPFLERVITVFFRGSQDMQRFRAGLELHWKWKPREHFQGFEHGGVWRVNLYSGPEVRTSDEVRQLAHLVNARVVAMNGQEIQGGHSGYYVIVDRDAPQFAG